MHQHRPCLRGPYTAGKVGTGVGGHRSRARDSRRQPPRDKPNLQVA
jgi:hypothetical protein